MARIHRLRAIRQLVGQTGLAVVVLLGLNQQSMAQDTSTKASGQTAAQHEPMDEDWQNISTRALLDQLTHMATQIERQRLKNAALESKVDALTQRLDGMQAALRSSGTLVLPPLPIEMTTSPKDESAILAKPLLPPLDLTKEAQKDLAPLETAPSGVAPEVDTAKKPGYIKKILDAVDPWCAVSQTGNIRRNSDPS